MAVLAMSGVFFVVFVVASAFLFLSTKRESGTRGSMPSVLGARGKIGVLEISGVIMDSKKTLERIEDLEESPEVKAIVVRINSPGGSVAPSQEIYEALKRCKKPTVASMSSVAASGGYYVALGTQKIYANPGTITGSIGVIMEFVNLERLYEWARVKRYALRTGKYKGAGSEYRELSPEERGILQGMIDNVLEQFKRAVVDSRKLKLEQVTELADGRVFSGEQAKRVRLVDELGTFQDAVVAAAKAAKLEGKPEVVYPGKKKRRLLDLLLAEPEDDDDFTSSRTGSGSISAILRMLGTLLTGADPAQVPAVNGPASSPADWGGLYWLWTGRG